MCVNVYKCIYLYIYISTYVMYIYICIHVYIYISYDDIAAEGVEVCI
jgi:hypothetical protein